MAVVVRALQGLSVFWVAWVAACSLSGALIGVISVLAPGFPLLVVSAVFAVPQWLVLRGRINNASLWLLITGVVGTLAWMMSGLFLAFYLILIPLMYPVALVLGALIGLFQWAVLHRAYPSTALGPWLAASALGTMGMVPACVDLVLASAVPEYRSLVPGTVGGAVYGVLTGTVLYREGIHRELISG